MLLNEIFDTRNEVVWKSTPSGARGYFQIDDEEYVIDVDEYTIQLEAGEKSVIDVGFRKGQSSQLTGDQKPARVIGSVLFGLRSKVEELKPNIIMFGALNKNGEVERRKAVYARIAALLSKTTNYNHLSEWYKFVGGEYAFMADFVPTASDEELIEKLAARSK